MTCVLIRRGNLDTIMHIVRVPCEDGLMLPQAKELSEARREAWLHSPQKKPTLLTPLF